jgi:phosphohistidine phosphatase
MVTLAARRLSEMRSTPLPRILTSPLVRARQTSEIVHGLLCSPDTSVEIHDDLQPHDAPPLTLVHDVTMSGLDTLVVGHQPSVEYLVRSLVSHPTSPLARGFRTAMIVGLALDVARSGMWTAELVVDPHELESS